MAIAYFISFLIEYIWVYHYRNQFRISLDITSSKLSKGTTASYEKDILFILFDNSIKEKYMIFVCSMLFNCINCYCTHL